MTLCSPYPHFSDVHGMYIVIPITMLLAIVALIGNSMVLLVILKREPLRTQSPYKFIASLAIADILVSTIGQPLYVAVIVSGSGYNCWLERVSHFCGSLSSSASALGLLIVSIDRYIFITKPLHYNIIMTPGRVYFALAYVWISAIMISFLPYLVGRKIFHTIVLSATVFDHVVTGCCYWTIYRVVTKKVGDELINNQNRSRRQRQATKTVAFVILAMALCWLPYIIASFIWGLNVKHWAPNSAIITVYFWLLALGHWNSAVNFLIYSWKNTELRSALKSFLGMRTNGLENTSSNNNDGSQTVKKTNRTNGESHPDTLTVETLV